MSTTPTTETLSVTETRERLSQLLNHVYRRETRVLVEENGVPVAAIISAEDLERLTGLEDRLADRRRILEDFGKNFAGIPAEELEREVGRALGEVRTEMGTDRSVSSDAA
ncbi:MAG TPA: type II toxin-antitoxin system Phd/YefM family antitoxin [Thermomicrobiales bacterium]|nr:type II toxin-antitoxin system Phd/YefM family antitoxin [Thermomicrobiales bacterium]